MNTRARQFTSQSSAFANQAIGINGITTKSRISRQGVFIHKFEVQLHTVQVDHGIAHCSTVKSSGDHSSNRLTLLNDTKQLAFPVKCKADSRSVPPVTASQADPDIFRRTYILGTTTSFGLGVLPCVLPGFSAADAMGAVEMQGGCRGCSASAAVGSMEMLERSQKGNELHTEMEARSLGDVASSQKVLATEAQTWLADAQKPLRYTEPGPYDIEVIEERLHLPKSNDDVSIILCIPTTSPKLDGKGFPVAIFSGGFRLDPCKYRGYIERLASWGFIAVAYDERSAARRPQDDIELSAFIVDIINGISRSSQWGNRADCHRVYLCGHSRGAKVSVVAAAADPRIVSLALIDPVDNTDYAPLALGYPSAVAVLHAGRQEAAERSFRLSTQGLRLKVPCLVVGAGKAGDCAPAAANYRQFFAAASAPSWKLVLPKASHLQFVEDPPLLESAVCGVGDMRNEDAVLAAEAAVVAWADASILKGPKGVSACLAIAAAQFCNDMRRTLPYVPMESTLLLDDEMK